MKLRCFVAIRWYHFFLGPLLWNRPAPEDAEEAGNHITDYRNRAALKVEEDALQTRETTDSEKSLPESPQQAKATEPSTNETPGPKTPQIEGPFILPRNLWIIVRYRIPALLLHGSSVDIHAMQVGEAGTKQEAHMRDVLSRAKQYPNEAEHLFSFLQGVTACTAVSPGPCLAKPQH